MENNRHFVKVVFDNGDHIKTEINGTSESICNYYIGEVFNIGYGGNDHMAKAVEIYFHDGEEFLKHKRSLV